ncbi:uncharacterized protein M6B38_116005 [Iris pallida]|uniref:Uncharacterized protein n=1 Tax=Iris pallida TaxID=29817 RepID=A0AAX6I6E7_IRIPA|nr:uncharacterized protein M6B38_116005 [Iris pallida]
MKLDTESPYFHTYPNEHAAKVIVHNDNHFILPRDNHVMADMLELGNGTLKEGIHGVKCLSENESCKVTLPPQLHGIVNMEDYTNRNMHEYDCVRAPYSAPNSEIGLVVKEDFYTNKSISEVELPEMIVCTNDGSCHKVENLSAAEEGYSFQNNLAKKEEVGQKVPLCSNNSLKNENNDVPEEMGGTRSLDFEYELIEKHSSTTIDRNPADPTSVNKSVKDFSSLSSIEDEDKLDTAEQVASIGSCHRLENLSIDEEVHYFKNSLPEEDEVGQKALFRTNNSLNNDNSDVANEMKGIASSHGFEHEAIDKDSSTTIDRNPADPAYIDKSVEKFSCVSSTESGDKLDAAEQVAINVSEDGDLLCRNDSTTRNILDDVAGKQLPPSDDLNKESLQEDLSVISCRYDQKHSIDRMKIDQAMLEGNKSTSTIVLSAAEDSDGDKEIISTCKVPNGVIAFTFDAKEASMRRREVKRDDKDIQQSKQAHSGPRTEGATSDGATTATPSSFLHLMQGESNFHGPSFLSGPIANSGHIPYSGSISIRSDSSTTSARSFAFPILQSEWNSSPVKMAKARRHGRKLFCCRF